MFNVGGDSSKHRWWEGEVEETVSSGVPHLKFQYLLVEVLKGFSLTVGTFDVGIYAPEFIHLGSFSFLCLLVGRHMGEEEEGGRGRKREEERGRKREEERGRKREGGRGRKREEEGGRGRKREEEGGRGRERGTERRS